MASPQDVKRNGTCKFCNGRLSVPYTRASHPRKMICRHLTNKDCEESKGKAELI